jgi:C_GCAxxG_C_C family probable redox protein
MKTTVPIDTEALCTIAGDLIDEGYHCSEAIMQVVGQAFLPDYDPLLFKISGGFCGGVGSTHENMCGAFSAGVMLLGAFQARVDVRENDQEFLQTVRDFRNEFISCLSTVNCQELLDKRNAAGEVNCRKYVEKTVKILMNYI